MIKLHRNDYLVLIIVVAVVIALFVPAILAARKNSRQCQDLSTLNQIGMKITLWSMDNSEVPPSLTNKSFLATLGSNETAFLKTSRITTPSGINDGVTSTSTNWILKAETANGKFTLYCDGSILEGQ